MPKIDLDAAPTGHGTSYPDAFAGPCLPRRRWRLGDAAGLDQFGVNLLRLPAGAWSSQRHWHLTEDEFVWVVSGEVVLVEGLEDEPMTETVLVAGDCAGFKAGVPNGHRIENRSCAEAVLLEVGTRNPTGDGADYPGIDMVLPLGADRYFHRDGTPYPKHDRRT
ncbi:cupin domain-containing protein [Brevundimonas sp. NIBR10]|uniref:cupin domain-containing protein n=1 Tax=Brevundimonas sp. NIBR10 TaxID=3015997 RepID=UPI0022F152B7|nr:cupin domain-containing protein [Brevundimonas sp. NIBR10]